MNKGIGQRSPAMDVIRCVALACVTSVHFFSRIGYYSEPLVGTRMYLMTLMRTAFMVCVPLFLLLSGYLCGRHRPCAAYYGKIRRILGIYALATLTGVIYRHAAGNGTLSLVQGVKKLLDYSGSDYGWYIEMYIGLFLLIPYLNVLYSGLETKKARGGLILTLVFLTALPAVVNVYKFTEPAWWAAPAQSTSGYDLILPDWWVNIYPLTYYFLGAFLRDHPLKAGRGTLLVLLVLATLADTAYVIWRCAGGLFIWGAWQNNMSVFLMIRSVLLFAWLQGADYGWMGPRLRLVLAKVSRWSLGAYLVSWIYDETIYRWLNAHVADVHLRLDWFPVAMPAVLLCSILTAAALEGTYDLLARGCSALRNRVHS